jgi:trk system potassium uptake protein
MRVSLIRATIVHGPFRRDTDPADVYASGMKVLIVGCGRVGSALALRMTDDGHDVTVIDEDAEALGRLPEDWPGRFLQGHGLDTDVLIDAGIESADAAIIATDGDNTNIVIAQIAKRKFNVPTVIARILDPLRAEWYEKQGVNTICPTRVAIEMLEKEVLEAASSSTGTR